MIDKTNVTVLTSGTSILDAVNVEKKRYLNEKRGTATDALLLQLQNHVLVAFIRQEKMTSIENRLKLEV